MERVCESRIVALVVAAMVATWFASVPQVVATVAADLLAIGLVAAVLVLRRRVPLPNVRRWLFVAAWGGALLALDQVLGTIGALTTAMDGVGGIDSFLTAAGYLTIGAGVFGLLAVLVGDDWVDLTVEVGVVAAIVGVGVWLLVLRDAVADSGPSLADLVALTAIATSAARVVVGVRLARSAAGARPLCVVATGWGVWFAGDLVRAVGGTDATVLALGDAVVMGATVLVIAGLADPRLVHEVWLRPTPPRLRPARQRWLLLLAVGLVPVAVQVAAVVGPADRLVLTGAVVLIGGALVLRAERARDQELRARADREDALEEALHTQRAVDEELRQMARVRNLFLRAISHQLRTPLTSIKGFATTLDRHGDVMAPELATELRSRILHNAERLELVVDALVDLDLLSRGMITPAEQLVDLAAVARRAVDDTPLGPRRVVLDVQSVQVVGDGALLGRAIRRLLDNAAKHTSAAATVHVRVGEQLGQAHVVVADDGPGVPPGLHETVFEPLVQGPAAATDPNPGVGLGLAIVRHVTRLHDGQAWVDDAPDGGARFHLLLPAVPVQRRRADDATTTVTPA